MGVGAGSSDEGAAACPAYLWPSRAAVGGRKVFMQSDCAACHTSLPYAAIREAAPRGAAQPKLAEIVVVVNEEQPATARPLQEMRRDLNLLRRNNLYTAHQELRNKMPLPTPVWLQFLKSQHHSNAVH